MFWLLLRLLPKNYLDYIICRERCQAVGRSAADYLCPSVERDHSLLSPAITFWLLLRLLPKNYFDYIIWQERCQAVGRSAADYLCPSVLLSVTIVATSLLSHPGLAASAVCDILARGQLRHQPVDGLLRASPEECVRGGHLECWPGQCKCLQLAEAAILTELLAGTLERIWALALGTG